MPTWLFTRIVILFRKVVSNTLSMYVELIEKSLKLHIHDPKRRHYAIYV
jgi:hypothetical protein